MSFEFEHFNKEEAEEVNKNIPKSPGPSEALEYCNTLWSEDEEEDDEIDCPQRNAVLHSKAVAKEFIYAYRKHRILWDSSHKNYRSKYLRARALDELVPILRKCDRTANREIVRRQINVFRTNYRKAQRRYFNSKIVKKGEERYTYTPNWRYYELQKFLGDVITQSDKGKMAGCTADSDPDDNTINKPSSFTESRKKQLKQSKTSSTNHGYSESVAIEIVDEASNEMFKLIGRNVALKLKRMTEDQRYQAELLVNKILINALRGRLNDATDVVGLPSKDKEGENEHGSDDDTADFDCEIDDSSYSQKPFACQ